MSIGGSLLGFGPLGDSPLGGDFPYVTLDTDDFSGDFGGDFIFTPTSAAGTFSSTVSASLGVAATTSAGTLLATVNETLTLTGVHGTTAAGVVTDIRGPVLPNNHATSAAGNLNFTLTNVQIGAIATSAATSPTSSPSHTLIATSTVGTSAAGTFVKIVGGGFIGNVATSSAGTLGIQVNENKTLSGTAATSAASKPSATSSNTGNLVGVQGNSNLGAFVASSGEALPISGANATTSAGVITDTSDENFSITGTAATSYTGTLLIVVGASSALVGVGTTSAINTFAALTVNENWNIASAAATSHAGTLIGIIEQKIITNAAATSAIGTFTRTNNPTFVGLSTTTFAATLPVRVDESWVVTGSAATSAVGVLSKRVDENYMLLGGGTTSTAGSFTSAGEQIPLQGVGATSSSGTLSAHIAITVQTIGVAGTSAAGTFVKNILHSLVGVQANANSTLPIEEAVGEIIGVAATSTTTVLQGTNTQYPTAYVTSEVGTLSLFDNSTIYLTGVQANSAANGITSYSPAQFILTYNDIPAFKLTLQELVFKIMQQW